MLCSNEQTSSLLNDIAISLLEQNCYFQAFETFKESSCRLRRGDGCKSDVAAKERLQSPQPFPNPPSIKYSSMPLNDLTNTSDCMDLIFDKIEDDDALLCIRLAETNESPSISSKLKSAIIKYNFGVAHYAYALAMQKKRRRVVVNNHIQTSNNMLKAAKESLSELCCRSSCSSCCQEKKERMGESPLGAVYTLPMLHLVVLLSLHKQVAGTPDEALVRKELIQVHSYISEVTDLLEKTQDTGRVFRARLLEAVVSEQSRLRSYSAQSA